MRDNARKYNLELSTLKACGLGISGTTCSFTVLENFSVDVDGTTFSYPTITTEQLKEINKPEFEQRVCHYLEYIDIESNFLKTCLVEEASYYDPLGDFVCNLNPNFLVYKFLTGVRIVDIGTPNGHAEYKAYPVGDDPSGYTWQTNATFLSLNLTQAYIFEVRDVIDGLEYCKVSKELLLSTLVPSTTEPPPSVQIYINEFSRNDYGPIKISQGFICSTPALGDGERVVIGYDLDADASGYGEACTAICCKPQGSTTYTEIRCAEYDGASNVTGNFTLRTGDAIKYSMCTLAPLAGSDGDATIKLTTVNGQGTTNPTIDVGRCSYSISETFPPITVTSSIARTSTTYPTNGITAKGTLSLTPNDFSPSETYTAEITACACSYFGATSSIQFYCKTGGVGAYNLLFTHNNGNPQPLITNIPIRRLDQICYTMSTTANNGASGGTCIQITNALTTFGIDPEINPSLKSDSIEKIGPPKLITVALCNQTDISDPGVCYKDGFITFTPNIAGSERVDVNVSGYAFYAGDADTTVEIFCKPAGSTGYVKIIDWNKEPYGPTEPSDSFTAYTDDCFCYQLYTTANTASTGNSADANLRITSVSGVGVNTTVCASKRDVSVSYYS